ncbi:unnamed protein product [Prorocentrum cordatum]|uniref:Uncharacterized protein n=1 Tax=Prorocentrum cordatum TaxID=2364126 RepID=A0ABN9XGC0_9DINO|nr:unnamed protein product [Polarella glacialis]
MPSHFIVRRADADRHQGEGGGWCPSEAPPGGHAFEAGARQRRIGRETRRPRQAHSEKQRSNIQKGYQRLEYLLDNWEEETTVCRPQCKRNPDAVRSYLGLRSTDDPLFKLEAILTKDALDDVVGDLDEYQDAVSAWNTAISLGNSDAFISSFGEFNPGGGREQVELYIEKSKENVVRARDSLKILSKALDIKV